MITLALIIIGIILGLSAIGIAWFLASFEVVTFVLCIIAIIAIVIAVMRK